MTCLLPAIGGLKMKLGIFCVCVCAHVRACVRLRACVRVHVRKCVRERARARKCECVRVRASAPRMRVCMDVGVCVRT